MLSKRNFSPKPNFRRPDNDGDKVEMLAAGWTMLRDDIWTKYPLALHKGRETFRRFDLVGPEMGTGACGSDAEVSVSASLQLQHAFKAAELKGRDEGNHDV